MMTKDGFRQLAQGNRKERLNALETKLASLEMASRISQMMTQQLMQNLKNMQEDLGKTFGILNEMQYKLLALQETSGVSVEQLNEIANVKRLKDFNEASDREDAESGFTVGTTVENNSTVIITSKTADVDRGIFRSRIELAKCGVPDLIKAFTGQTVGVKTTVKLNGVDHEVELLGIRQPSNGNDQIPQQAVAGTDVQAEGESEGSDTSALQTGNTELVGNA